MHTAARATLALPEPPLKYRSPTKSPHTLMGRSLFLLSLFALVLRWAGAGASDDDHVTGSTAPGAGDLLRSSGSSPVLCPLFSGSQGGLLLLTAVLQLRQFPCPLSSVLRQPGGACCS